MHAMPAASEREIEVFRIRYATLLVSGLGAVLLQTVLPLVIPIAGLMDFPLVVTVYFTLIRQNKVFGIALGTGLGLMQDALSHGYLGMYGMSKAVVGYLAAAAAMRFNFETLFARCVMTGALVVVHDLCFSGLQHALLDSPPPFLPLERASAILFNMALALILFPLLDRFR